MENEGFSNEGEEQLRKAYEQFALHDYPNPNRIGCPTDKQVLKDLAAKKLSPSDPVIQHVAECSPCFSEVKEFRRQSQRAKSSFVAAMGATTLAAILAFFFLNQHFGWIGSEREIAGIMDFRSYSNRRSETSSPQSRALVTLPRGHVAAKILLPIGIPEGSYEFKILNDSLQPVVTGGGQVRIMNHVTTLSSHLDTSRLPSGHYTFFLRQTGEEWQQYPLFIE